MSKQLTKSIAAALAKQFVAQSFRPECKAAYNDTVKTEYQVDTKRAGSIPAGKLTHWQAEPSGNGTFCVVGLFTPEHYVGGAPRPGTQAERFVEACAGHGTSRKGSGYFTEQVDHEGGGVSFVCQQVAKHGSVNQSKPKAWFVFTVNGQTEPAMQCVGFGNTVDIALAKAKGWANRCLTMQFEIKAADNNGLSNASTK